MALQQHSKHAYVRLLDIYLHRIAYYSVAKPEEVEAALQADKSLPFCIYLCKYQVLGYGIDNYNILFTTVLFIFCKNICTITLTTTTIYVLLW